MVNMLFQGLKDAVVILKGKHDLYKELQKKHDNLNKEYQKLMRAYNELRAMYFEEYHENERSRG